VLADTLAQRGHVVIGTSRRGSGISADGVRFLDLAEVEAAPNLPAADVAFICAAMTNIADCRAKPELAWRTNAAGPAILADRLSARGVQTILLSTSAVFDCRAPLMKADRPREPATVYGKSKRSAEDAVLAVQNGTVLRLTKVLPPGWPLLRRWLQALRHGQNIQAVTDHRIAPLIVGDVVDALIAIATSRSTGALHVSASRDLAYDELATRLAGRMGLDRSLISPCRATDIGIPAEEVMPYTSLDGSRLAALTGRSAPDPYVAVDRTIDTLKGG
jgi:dTDP-4-dehydrorhamnose reductase